MPGIKDFLTLINGKINSQALSDGLAASDLKEVEFDDETFGEIEKQVNGLMSLEAAKSSPDVTNALKDSLKKTLYSEFHQKAKGEILHGVEKELAPIAKKFDLNIEGKGAHDIIKEIHSHTSNIDVKPDERVSHLTKEAAELHKQLAKAEKQREKLEAKHAGEIEGIKIQTAADKYLSSAPLSSATRKDDILMTGIRSKMDAVVQEKGAVLKFENGKLTPFRKDNPEQRLFDEKNQEIGIDGLWGPIFQPYVQATPPAEPGVKTPGQGS